MTQQDLQGGLLALIAQRICEQTLALTNQQRADKELVGCLKTDDAADGAVEGQQYSVCVFDSEGAIVSTQTVDLPGGEIDSGRPTFPCGDESLVGCGYVGVTCDTEGLPTLTEVPTTPRDQLNSEPNTNNEWVAGNGTSTLPTPGGIWNQPSDPVNVEGGLLQTFRYRFYQLDLCIPECNNGTVEVCFDVDLKNLGPYPGLGVNSDVRITDSTGASLDVATAPDGRLTGQGVGVVATNKVCATLTPAQVTAGIFLEIGVETRHDSTKASLNPRDKAWEVKIPNSTFVWDMTDCEVAEVSQTALAGCSISELAAQIAEELSGACLNVNVKSLPPEEETCLAINDGCWINAAGDTIVQAGVTREVDLCKDPVATTFYLDYGTVDADGESTAVEFEAPTEGYFGDCDSRTPIPEPELPCDTLDRLLTPECLIKRTTTVGYDNGVTPGSSTNSCGARNNFVSFAWDFTIAGWEVNGNNVGAGDPLGAWPGWTPQLEGWSDFFNTYNPNVNSNATFGVDPSPTWRFSEITGCDPTASYGPLTVVRNDTGCVYTIYPILTSETFTTVYRYMKVSCVNGKDIKSLVYCDSEGKEIPEPEDIACYRSCSYKFDPFVYGPASDCETTLITCNHNDDGTSVPVVVIIDDCSTGRSVTVYTAESYNTAETPDDLVEIDEADLDCALPDLPGCSTIESAIGASNCPPTETNAEGDCDCPVETAQYDPDQGSQWDTISVSGQTATITGIGGVTGSWSEQMAGTNPQCDGDMWLGRYGAFDGPPGTGALLAVGYVIGSKENVSGSDYTLGAPVLPSPCSSASLRASLIDGGFTAVEADSLLTNGYATVDVFNTAGATHVNGVFDGGAPTPFGICITLDTDACEDTDGSEPDNCVLFTEDAWANQTLESLLAASLKPSPTSICACYGDQSGEGSTPLEYVNQDNSTDVTASQNTNTIKWEIDLGGQDESDASGAYIADCIANGGEATIVWTDLDDNSFTFVADTVVGDGTGNGGWGFTGIGDSSGSAKVATATITCSAEDSELGSGVACKWVGCDANGETIIEWRDKFTDELLTGEQISTLAECTGTDDLLQEIVDLLGGDGECPCDEETPKDKRCRAYANFLNSGYRNWSDIGDFDDLADEFGFTAPASPKETWVRITEFKCDGVSQSAEGQIFGPYPVGATASADFIADLGSATASACLQVGPSATSPGDMDYLYNSNTKATLVLQEGISDGVGGIDWFSSAQGIVVREDANGDFIAGDFITSSGNGSTTNYDASDVDDLDSYVDAEDCEDI